MKPQKVDDKIIEVVAHKGSIHLIQIKAGVTQCPPPTSIAAASLFRSCLTQRERVGP